MVPTRINGRWNLLLPEHRAHRPEWPWWEATRLAAMANFIGNGDVVYDIGAEEGDFPALFAQWGAEVVLVEPNPKVWPNIKAIFEANDLVNKIAGSFVGFAAQGIADAEVGLGWQEAVIQARLFPKCADGPVIGDHGFRHLAQETDTTPQITLGHLAYMLDVQPTHITIDVEGSELSVLRGAQGVLRESRPYVWCSVHPDPLKDFYCEDPQAVYDLMESLDYKRVFLTFDHESHELFVPTEKCWPL